MWQKIRSMWVYAHDNFLDDYDYFHIAGDDAYVVVDNMRSFLQGAQIERLLNGYIDTLSRPHYERTKRWEHMSEGQKRPLLLGIPLTKGNELFPQGGGGYTLNREALRLIGDEGGPLHTLLTDNVDSREDVFIAGLLDAVDTHVSDTRDEAGAFRYIPYRPKHRVRGKAKYKPVYEISPVL
jgi:glycoprotein-N-acetylgalactosamine 3-beta-galactosyltransferase